MPELSFSIEGAHVLVDRLEPAIGLSVHIGVDPRPTHVYSLSLTYDVRIDAVRRRYAADEQQRLISLFGPIGHWHHTLHSLSWASGAAQVPAFIGEKQVELALPCRGELNPAISRYLQALTTGDALLVISFGGTAFFASDDVPLQMSRIPWDCQAAFRLPLNVWRQAREQHCQQQTSAHLV